MQTRQDGADVRVGGAWTLHQIEGNILAAANITGTGGTAQDLW